MFFSFIIFICLAVIPSFAEETAVPSVPCFSLNLILNDDTDASTAQISPAPLLIDDDMIGYDWEKHEFIITKDAAARISRHLTKIGAFGKWFVISVGGERRYSGAFWSPLSSVSCDHPVILYCEDNQERLQIASGYPDVSAAPQTSGAGVRDDRCLQVKLIARRKLLQDGLLRILPQKKAPMTRHDVFDFRETALPDELLTANRSAYQALYRRLGRETYQSLKGDILESAPAFRFSWQVLAAMRVFLDTEDAEAAENLLRAVDPRLIRATTDWRALDILVSRFDSDDLYLEFIGIVPPGAYRPQFSGRDFESLRERIICEALGEDSEQGRARARHYCDVIPEEYARVMCRLEDADELMRRLNGEILQSSLDGHASGTDARRRLAVSQMASFFRKSAAPLRPSHTLRLENFLEMLDPDDFFERFLFCELQAECGNYSRCIEIVRNCLDAPAELEELFFLPGEQIVQLRPSQLEELCRLARRVELLRLYLLNHQDGEASRLAKETAVFSGDPWMLVNSFSLQAAAAEKIAAARGDGRRVQSVLELPRPDTWEYYRLAYQQKIGEERFQEAGDVLLYAIQFARNKGEFDFLVEALTARADWLVQYGNNPKGGAEVLREAADLCHSHNLTVNHEIRLRTVSKYLHYLADTKPEGWQDAFEDCGRREFNDNQTGLLVYFFQTLHREFLPTDTIFRYLTSDKYQRRNGFNSDAHSCRLTYMPIRFYEKYVRDAMEDFRHFARFGAETAPHHLRIVDETCPEYHFRKTLLARYLTDGFPEAFENDDNLWTDSLEQREYWRAKEICESRWESGRMTAPNRLRALLILQEKSPSPEEMLWLNSEIKNFRDN